MESNVPFVPLRLRLVMVLGIHKVAGKAEQTNIIHKKAKKLRTMLQGKGMNKVIF